MDRAVTDHAQQLNAADANDTEEAHESGTSRRDALENTSIREMPTRKGSEPELSQDDAPDTQPLNLSTGPAKSGVTGQSIALPQGDGSIQGMGESFSPNLSSGTVSFRVPISLPAGRNNVGPTLGLSYSTGGGNGILGVGWDLDVPFISRQTDKGLPHYRDQATWHVAEDRFVYSGGQELVPVDGAAASAVDGAPVPAEFAGWQQYRARVEGVFMRFFRAPDSSRWVVQDKSGARFEFGRFPFASATVSDPEEPQHIFAWHLVRMSSPHGASVHYRYVEDAGSLYLSDIFYDMPGYCGVAGNPAATRACSAALSQYGRRVRFVYEPRPDLTSSYLSTWRVENRLRLRRLEVTSALGTAGARYLVRRYHFGYDAQSYHSLLTRVQLEGRPSTADGRLGVEVGLTNVPEAALNDAKVGQLLPPIVFSYTRAASTTEQISGFGGIDATVKRSASSPDHSLDEARTDLFDVNADGLPDVLVTDPARFDDGVGVYFNGFPGGVATQAGQFSAGIRVGVPAGMSGVMTLSNANLMPLDLDGDGRVELVHTPRNLRGGSFVVSKAPSSDGYAPLQGWSFHYVVDRTTNDRDPRIDLGSETLKTLDVNNDGRIDLVRTTGTSVQTWLNLSGLPGGAGGFGSVPWTAGDAPLSSQPIETCLPVAGTPLDFADPATHFTDMNGDGLLDIVRAGFSQVVYWPGRGDGAWGDGPHECDPTSRHERHIEMSDAPIELDPELSGMQFADVNADGTSDLVVVGFDRMSVWFNRGGHGFTDRIVVRNVPFTTLVDERVRIADLDGSGTVDIIHGRAGAFEWIDPMGGVRPRLLASVDNGLGALTTIEYGSAAEDYLRDLSELGRCDPAALDCFTWQREPLSPGRTAGDCDDSVLDANGGCVHRPTGTPVVATVLRSVKSSDRFDRLGLAALRAHTEFRYHDGYYEGVEHEFRGFGAADTTIHGDSCEPTSVQRSFLHQGRRPSNIAADPLADNPNEALKGLSFLSEQADQLGTYVETNHSTYAVRRLLVGLDGRAVSYAYVKQSDTYRYDTAPFTPAREMLTLASVVREEAGEGLQLTDPVAAQPGDAPHHVKLRGARALHLVTTTDLVDNAGNQLRKTLHGRAGSGEQIIEQQRVTRIDDSTCGATGWLWRAEETSRRGHDDNGGPLGRTVSYHDACGNAVLSEVPTTLPASPTFRFDSPDAGVLAYSPANFVTMSSVRYDAWGQPNETCEGADLRTARPRDCDRYGSVGRDAAYSTFVEREERALVATASGFSSVVTTARWDQGLGVVVSATEPNGGTTALAYDGLGRLTATQVPNVAACAGAQVPAQRFIYELTPDPGSRPVSRARMITELSCEGIGQAALETLVYTDGFGRVRAVLHQGDADPMSWADHRGHAFTRTGFQVFGAKGKVCAQYDAGAFDGSADDYRAVLAPPGTPAVRVFADAFGREQFVVERDQSYTQQRYHADSVESWDAIDLGLDPSAPACFEGTYKFVELDGHGRSIHQRVHQRRADCTAEEFHHLYSYYRADGAVLKTVRALAPADVARPPAGSHVGLTRWVERNFVYDDQGRTLASFDADTDNRQTSDDGQRSWRYLYNRQGEVAAVRDPRGCGQNFFYDMAGRLVGEQYVSCAESLRSAEAPNETVPAGSLGQTRITAGLNVHVRYHFDEYPSWAEAVLPTDSAPTAGRATGVTDRGQRSVVAYDERGLAVFGAKQVAMIARPSTYVASGPQNGPQPVFVEQSPEAARPAPFDSTHTYLSSTVFDHAGRVVSSDLPSDPDFGALNTMGPRVAGFLSHDAAGRPKGARVEIGAGPQTRYDVVQNVRYTGDGLPTEVTYGDGHNGRQPTTSTTLYDVRRRPIDIYTLRTASAEVSGDELGSVSVVTDQRLNWDMAGNLISIHDQRPGHEWKDGFRPQTADIVHDALYRVQRVDFRYTDDDDTLSAFDDATDWRSTVQRHRATDPMKSSPAPMLARPTGNRVVQLKYAHDWLGNMTDFDDDAAQFFERSIGKIANGGDVSTSALRPAERPSALYLASNLSATRPSDRGGWVQLEFGLGGNTTAMTVHAQCVDASPAVCADPGPTRSLAERRQALRDSCRCTARQHFSYRYDELNRIAEARRFDWSGTAWALKVRQRYRYDGGNQRTLKETIDVVSGDTRAALYPTPGDFERRGLRIADRTYDAIAGETETQYLIAGARLVWENSDRVLETLDPAHRITFAVGDLTESTVAVIDLVSGALLEVSGFYPTGAREHWLDSSQAAAANVPLEPEGFTGKEADEDVGLVYFGERYLIPRIARWATPDPLHIHQGGGGETGNAYHYISGNLLQARDPLGLNSMDDYKPPAPPALPDVVQPGYGDGHDAGRAEARAAVTAYVANNYGTTLLENANAFEGTFEGHVLNQMYRANHGLDSEIRRLPDGTWASTRVAEANPTMDEPGYMPGYKRGLAEGVASTGIHGMEYLHDRAARLLAEARSGGGAEMATGEMGARAEAGVIRLLRDFGVNARGFQNRSGHGLDIAWQSNGTVWILDSKATRGSRARITNDQKNQEAWAMGALARLKESPHLSAKDQALLAKWERDILSGKLQLRTAFAEVSGVGSGNVGVRFFRLKVNGATGRYERVRVSFAEIVRYQSRPIRIRGNLSK